MRHRKAARKLSRTSAHRRALYSNLVAALVRFERIETTLAKAKELRGVAERTINRAVSVSDLYQRGLEKLSREERAQIVHAKRMARRVLKDTDALAKLFSDVAPRYVGRPGGYTRVLKTRTRRGDAAPMAFIELVPSEAPAAAKPDKTADKSAETDTDEATETKKAPAKKKAPARKKKAKDEDE